MSEFLPAGRERLLGIYDELCAAKCIALVRDLRLFEAEVDPRAQVVKEKLLAFANELGVLRGKTPTARIAKAAPFGELLARHAADILEDPIGFQWLMRGLDSLHPVLSGSVLAEEALFPRTDFGLASKLYSESLIFSYFSKQAAHLAISLRPSRVFELGAGTGGTAKAVLAGTDARYLFTDISTLFLSPSPPRGERVGERGVEFRQLDMDTERWDLGSDFDVSLALNVVHLAKSIPEVLRKLRESLTPGGVLLLGEVSAPLKGKCFPFMDFTFGLLPSFKGTLLTPSEWTRALTDAGFASIDFLPLTRSDAADSPNYGGVYLARRSGDV